MMSLEKLTAADVYEFIGSKVAAPVDEKHCHTTLDDNI